VSGTPTCREVVELVTDYLEGAMPPEDREVFERHLLVCPPCATYLDQIRSTAQAARTLHEDDVPAEVMDGLLEAFRGWKREADPNSA
jgi:anti-sigma factor RsiW